MLTGSITSAMLRSLSPSGSTKEIPPTAPQKKNEIKKGGGDKKHMQVELSLLMFGLLVSQTRRGRSEKVQKCRCREPVRSAAQQTGAHSGADPPPLKHLLHLSFMSGSVAVILVGPCCPAPLLLKCIQASSKAGGEERADWLLSGGEAGCSLLPSRTDMKS